MQEKRRSKRLPVQLELVVSRLFRQEEITLNINEPITVVDVSKLGIGFMTAADMPLNYYFNAKLELGNTENSLYCVVRIIRKVPKEEVENSFNVFKDIFHLYCLRNIKGP